MFKSKYKDSSVMSIELVSLFIFKNALSEKSFKIILKAYFEYHILHYLENEQLVNSFSNFILSTNFSKVQ